MAFDSDGKYYDPTLVNTKKAEAVLKEFASNTGGTQPTDNQQAQDEICSYHLPACVCTWDENRACEVTPCYPIRKLSSMR